MLFHWVEKVDFMILNWIQEHIRCKMFDWIMPIITFLGEKGWFFILVALIFLFISKTRKWGACLLTSLSLGYIFGNLLIKNIIARMRPYDQVEYITLLIDKLCDYSFPSGHTLAAFEFFTVILFMPVKKIYKILSGFLAFLMAFSRLYLYVHFPSDILAGMILGILFGVMGVRIVNMILEEHRLKNMSENKK